MTGVVRQIGRIWVTILVAYALLANAMLPGFAMGGMADIPPGVLCMPSLADDSGPAKLPGQDTTCCILCAVAAAPALTPPSTVVVPVRFAVLWVDLPSIAPAPHPGSPAVWPQSPRAPPITV